MIGKWFGATTLCGMLFAVSLARAVPAPECLVSWHAATTTCRDGDPACDADGVADGTCTFAATLCVRQAGCEAALVGALAVRASSGRASWPTDLRNGCAAAQSVPVALGGRARRRVTLAATARDAAGRMDRDRLRLTCRGAGATAAARAIVVTTDFEIGLLQRVRVTAPYRVGGTPDPIHSDAVVRVAGDRVYVVNRLGGDFLQTIDPRRGFRTVRACSLGVGANPHDVAVVDRHRAYVTRYDTDRLWVVDPEAPGCNGFREDAIDLGGYADADGLPEMDQLLLDGDRVWVSLQRLDRTRNFVPSAKGSLLLAIDTTTNAVVAEVPLLGTNAFGDASGIQREPGTGHLLVNQAGNIYRTGDGGIERIDPSGPRSLGYAIDERTLGGNITDFVVLSPTKGYAIVLDEQLRNRLIAFDPQAGTRGAQLLASEQFLPDVAVAPDGRLWVADRTRSNPGIRIFDPTTDRQVTTAPILLELPPFAIGFVP